MSVIYVRDPESGQFVAIPTLRGEPGQNGAQGEQGIPGEAATVQIGQITTGEPGSDAQVTNTGTKYAAVLNFTIPRGQQGVQGAKGEPGQNGNDGQAATITVGTVTTGNAGSNASVINAGTSNAARLNFVIPRGDKGEKGNDGADGNDGQAATVTVGSVDTGTPGTPAVVTNSGNEHAAILNFTIPRGNTGAKGDKGDDGHTPVKGVDYWTAADQEQIKSEVSASVTDSVTDAVSCKYITKTLAASGWYHASESEYTQSFTDANIKANYKIEIGLDSDELLQIMNDGVMSIRIDNDNGTAEVVCLGEKPTIDLHAQISFVRCVKA